MSSAQPLADRIQHVRDEALHALERVDSAAALEAWRTQYLGRRGALSLLLREVASLPAEERRSTGAVGNEARAALEERLEAAQARVQAAEARRAQEAGRLDVTLPGRPVPLGRLHPLTQTVREVCSAFAAMGFQVVEGPEVEWDYYNFQALNIPQDHPARDQFSTLWIDYRTPDGQMPMLLRTHTSPMQVRVMEQAGGAPVRVVVPGKVFRFENRDATHESQFSQVEGLAVDEGITFSDLRGTLYEFARQVFGAERRVRFRCDYFPFVEPGVDMAIDCFLCGGKGCPVCKRSGWIEVMGAGMVHPNVLRGVGYDPERYTGFAFGIGVERIAMLKHGVDDIRLFYGNDLRFLRQF